MRSDSLRSQPLHEVVGPFRLAEAREAREYAATHGQREMKRVVPIGHAGSYRLVDPVIGLRKAVDGCTPAQLSIAWLLQKAPFIVPIVGTTNEAHLEEDLAAAKVKLSLTRAVSMISNTESNAA